MEMSYRILFYEKNYGGGSVGANVTNIAISDIFDRPLVEKLVRKCFEKASVLHDCLIIKFVVSAVPYRSYWMGEGVNDEGGLRINWMECRGSELV